MNLRSFIVVADLGEELLIGYREAMDGQAAAAMLRAPEGAGLTAHDLGIPADRARILDLMVFDVLAHGEDIRVRRAT